jgi:hypothetical protein
MVTTQMIAMGMITISTQREISINHMNPITHMHDLFTTAIRSMVPGVISQKTTNLMSILPRVNIPRVNIPRVNIPRVNIPRVNMFRLNLPRVKSTMEMRNKTMFVLNRKLNIPGMWANIKNTPNMRQRDGV